MVRGRSLAGSRLTQITALALDDIMSLSPKFWNMHIDPNICFDGAATTLLTIQYNLAAGTLGAFVERADIASIVDDILNFKAMLVASTFMRIILK